MRGVLLREDRDTLVVQATPDEVHAFAQRHVGREVRLCPARVAIVVGGAAPEQSPRMGVAVGRVDPGDYLYDREGRPVATVDDVEVHVERLVEMTALGDAVRQFVRGETRVGIRASGLPGVTVGG